MYSIEEVNEKTPIRDLHPLIAVRTINILLRAGYKTVGDILNLTEDDVVKCRNAGRRTVEDAMRFISEYKEYHEEKPRENMISVDKLLEYCKKCADASQKIADNALNNIGKGESEQSAFSACAFFLIQEKIYRYDIPDIIRAFMDGGAENG